jgi:predicted negative regulator of RcsB-dependent stress response
MTDDLIREINDAVQRDRAASFFKQYGKALIGLGLVAMIAGGGWLYYEKQREVAKQEITRGLTDGREQFIAGQYRKSAETFAAMKKDKEIKAHPELAALWETKALIKLHQSDKALDVLAGALPKAQEPYRSLLCIQGLLLNAQDDRFADCEATKNEAFASLVSELEAIEYLRAGNYKAAKEALPKEGNTTSQRQRLADLNAYLAALAPAEEEKKAQEPAMLKENKDEK